MTTINRKQPDRQEIANRVEFPQQQITAFCQRYHIRKLALFGSVLREDFRPDSDVDVLVEFAPGHVPSLIKMAELEIELSRILGRKADLRTPAELSRYFRQQVIDQAQVQYECQ